MTVTLGGREVTGGVSTLRILCFGRGWMEDSTDFLFSSDGDHPLVDYGLQGRQHSSHADFFYCASFLGTSGREWCLLFSIDLGAHCAFQSSLGLYVNSLCSLPLCYARYSY